MSLSEIAQTIIAASTYMTLSTTTDDQPWACALFFGVDDDYNLYFVSNVRSVHVQKVLQNPKVAVTIFDSHSKPGEANGVQLSGICQRLTGEELQQGIDAIYSKRFPDLQERSIHVLTPEKFSKLDNDPSAYHIYRITPDNVYVLNKAVGEDARFEVMLRKQKHGDRLKKVTE